MCIGRKTIAKGPVSGLTDTATGGGLRRSGRGRNEGGDGSETFALEKVQWKAGVLVGEETCGR